MPMPKGFKAENGYFTAKSSGGLAYREIAEIMTASGDKMNHATARNVFIKGLIKIARKCSELQGVEKDDRELKKIACDPRFQSALCEIYSNTLRSDLNV